MGQKETHQQIADLMAQEQHIASQLQLLVNDARARGSTWQEIGESAGISRQTAHRRWTDKGRQGHRNAQRLRRAQARGELPFSPADEALVRPVTHE